MKPRGQEAQRFDAVFLACHSDETLRLLADPDPREREVLGAIRYRRNEAVLHTDARLLPRSALAHAAWNYHRLAEEAVEHLAIVEALLAGDPKAAARAMARHIRSGLRYWSRALPAGNGQAVTPKHRGTQP